MTVLAVCLRISATSNASPIYRIVNVVLARSFDQVVRINARRVVARVPNNSPNWPAEVFRESSSVSESGAVDFPGQNAVSAFVSSPLELNAIASHG